MINYPDVEGDWRPISSIKKLCPTCQDPQGNPRPLVIGPGQQVIFPTKDEPELESDFDPYE